MKKLTLVILVVLLATNMILAGCVASIVATIAPVQTTTTAVPTTTSPIPKTIASTPTVPIQITLENGSAVRKTTYYVSKSEDNGYSIGDPTYDGLAKVHTEGTTGPKDTVSDAIDAASSGDMIVINDGTYDETLSITKGLDLEPQTDYQAIIAGTGVSVNTAVADGSTVTLGKIVLEGLDVNNYGLTINKATPEVLYTVVLNQTKIQGFLKDGIYINTATKLDFAANGMILNCLAMNQISPFGFAAIDLAEGQIIITGGSITTGLALGSHYSACPIFVLAAPLVTVTGVTIVNSVGTIANIATVYVANVAGTLGSPGVTITHNTITIQDANADAGSSTGIVVVGSTPNSCNYANISYNTINCNYTGTGLHGILVGKDLISAADASYQSVNYASVHHNKITGNAAISNIFHGILIANQIGGLVYNNRVDSAYLGIGIKGDTGGVANGAVVSYNIVSRCTSWYIGAKGSNGSKFYNNTCILTNGYATSGTDVYHDDSATKTVSTNIAVKNNLFYSTATPTYFNLVESGSDATFANNLYYDAFGSYAFAYGANTYTTVALWMAAHETTAINSDPLFVNYALGNYHIAVGSPAQGAGVDVGLLTNYDDKPIIGLPDIGAEPSVGDGIAAKLTFTTQPSADSAAGVNLGTQPILSVQDSSGNTVTTSTVPVILTITAGSGTGGAVLSGTATVNAVHGVAAFRGLKIDKAGTGYTLTATSGTLTPAISQVFTVVHPGDANLDGTVDIADVTEVERIILELDPKTCACDANGSGVVDMGDVVKIERIILERDPLIG